MDVIDGPLWCSVCIAGGICIASFHGEHKQSDGEGAWKSSPRNLKPRTTSWNHFRPMGHLGLTKTQRTVFLLLSCSHIWLVSASHWGAACQISLHRPMEAQLSSLPQCILEHDKSLLVFSGSSALQTRSPSRVAEGDAHSSSAAIKTRSVFYSWLPSQ